MIRSIIIDDEPHCITALQHDLKMFCPHVAVLDTCASGKEGLMAIKKHQPDLVFLDVEMPWMNGFEMLEVIDGNINFQIIFTTAYDQFAARAFRVSAIDYLLKPIDGQDLAEAVLKVSKAMQGTSKNSHITNMLQNAKLPAGQQKIALPIREGYDFVPVADILYLRAEGSYTYIYFDGKPKTLLSKSLGETEQLLPPELFERIHHSILINMQHISQLHKTDGMSVLMKNGDELPVAKSKKDKLLERVGIR